MGTARYSLPALPYGYADLEPLMSELQLTIHHQKHHQAYVDAANGLLDKLAQARADGVDLDLKSTLKSLSWNVAGHVLHSLFWEGMAPAGRGGQLEGPLAEALLQEFGSIERFRREFTQTAASVEGSGWTALTRCSQTGRLLIMQVEKHNVNLYPTFDILMVVDVFEHAYYVDYRNDRGKFLEAWWELVNWEVVGRRFAASRG
ncbi:MAG: superoxide dismutase [Syntrophomonadaceae bacterium]|nr:superoxide dismutase [Syntrophomonadaceae bacterium]MDH7497817.1 superoxide dismutase [Syntrophomonadaceae bacterium]